MEVRTPKRGAMSQKDIEGLLSVLLEAAEEGRITGVCIAYQIDGVTGHNIEGLLSAALVGESALAQMEIQARILDARDAQETENTEENEHSQAERLH